MGLVLGEPDYERRAHVNRLQDRLASNVLAVEGLQVRCDVSAWTRAADTRPEARVGHRGSLGPARRKRAARALARTDRD